MKNKSMLAFIYLCIVVPVFLLDFIPPILWFVYRNKNPLLARHAAYATGLILIIIGWVCTLVGLKQHRESQTDSLS